MAKGDDSVQLLFGGDYSPRGRYDQLIATKGSRIFGDLQECIDQADFAIVNLETPICNSGQGITKIGPNIRAAPGALRTLNEAGFDAVCLANNHILDFGRDGLSQTLDSLRAYGIHHVGAGLDRETAEACLRFEIKGRRVSIFSFAEREFNISDDGLVGAAMLDPIRFVPLLLEERANADAVIVCVHGGNEYFPYPRPGLRRLCQFLIEIGADAVIGHHPHVPGPYEIYKGKPIIYSLGNLIFDSKIFLPGWDEGYFANLDLTFGNSGLRKMKIALIPYRQAVSRGGLQQMLGPEKVDFLARIERMRDQLENRPQEWLDAWKGFVGQKQAQVLIDMSSPVRFRGFRRFLSFRLVRNLIVRPSRQIHRLNLLRCESHRELLISACEASVHEPRDAKYQN